MIIIPVILALIPALMAAYFFYPVFLIGEKLHKIKEEQFAVTVSGADDKNKND